MKLSKITMAIALGLLVVMASQVMAQENVLYIVVGPHQDIGFYYGYKASMDEYRAQLGAHIALIETNPDISFSMGNTYNTKDFVKQHPKQKERLKRLMAAGKITTPPQWVGGEFGWYSGEYLVRTTAYAKYWVMSQLEHEPHWFQFNDTPSLTPQLSQILNKSGVDLLVGNRPPALAYRLGEGRPWYFVGLDGSRVILYIVEYDNAINFSDGYDAWGNVREINHWARQWAGRFKEFKIHMSQAITDRGTEPSRSRRLKTNVKIWNEKYAKKYGFRVAIKTVEDYARYLKKEVVDKKIVLPETSALMYPWPWAGMAWDQPRVHQLTMVESQLPTVEKLAAINELLKIASYPYRQINRAWDDILWFSDHNWGTKDVEKAKNKSIKKAYELTNKLLQDNLKKLAGNIAYKNRGTPVMVFNPLNWERTEAVSVDLNKVPQGKWAVVDAKGKAMPAQLTSAEGTQQLRLLFQAKTVPGMGYKSFYLVDRLSDVPKVDTDLLTGGDFVENSFYKVTVAPDGSVKSIYDKQANRELVDDSKEDKFGAMNGYGRDGNKFTLLQDLIPSGFKIVEQGPARVSLQVTGHTLRGKLPIKITLRLSAHTPWVEHEIQLDTGPVRGHGSSTMVYYSAPFKDLSNKGQVGVPYGSVPHFKGNERLSRIRFSRRSPKQAMITGQSGDGRGIVAWCHDIQKWLNLGDSSYSVDLAFDNIQARTYFKDTTYPLTNLMASYKGDVANWRFLIRGHKGNWQDNDTPRFGWEASNPLLPIVAQRGNGKLPDVLSFITLSTPEKPKGNNVVLSVFKKAFDGKGYVVRFYEAEDEDTLVALKVNKVLNMPQAEVSRTNLIEQPFEVLTSKDSQYLISVLGYGIESVRFFPERVTDITKPAAVTDLKVDSFTSTTVKLTWTASGDDKHKGAASRYELRVSSKPIGETNWNKARAVKVGLRPQVAGKRERFVVKNLDSGSKYYFALKVVDEADNSSPASNSIAAQMEDIDTMAPAAVTDLRVSKVISTSISLQWSASGDDERKGQAAKYMISYASQPINENNWSLVNLFPQSISPKAAGSKEGVTISGLTPFTQYYFVLKVVDEADNTSSISNLVKQDTTKLRTMLLQKGVSDTHVSNVNELEAEMNYGKTPFTRNWAWGRRNVLLKFKLGSIPANAKIFKATLKLYAYDITYGDAGKVIAYRLTQAWDENSTNWSKAGKRKKWRNNGGTIDKTTDYGRGPNGLVARAPVTDGGGWVELDVTRLVQDWLSGKSPNYGFLLKGNCPEDCGIYYRSAEYSKNKKLRPILEISY